MRTAKLKKIGGLLLLMVWLSGSSFQENASGSEKSADIALYTDQGTGDNCVQATENMFRWMGYTVDSVSASGIRNGCLSQYRLLCMPGGDMYQYSQDLSSSGLANIRAFIQGGGAYIGICGGAYFTGSRVVWQGNVLPMTPLGLFQGTTQGPVNEISPYPYCCMCRMNMVNPFHTITRTGPESAWILYCYGPMFLPEQGANFTVLGVYEAVNQPAMAAFHYGQGRVFIIGTHPEIEEDSDRDGVTFGDSFDDRGSDWDLMARAAFWCLKGFFVGDLDEDWEMTAVDLSILRHYLVDNLSPETFPFTAPLDAADINGDEQIDAVDLALEADLLVGNEIKWARF